MSSSIKAVLKPHLRDIGSLTVRRVLPALAARLIGPFIFFDHMGPATLEPGVGLDVRPHPHIGLATVTYLFDGEIIIATVSAPSRRSPRATSTGCCGARHRPLRAQPAEDAQAGVSMHGIQTWVALPLDDEGIDRGSIITPPTRCP